MQIEYAWLFKSWSSSLCAGVTRLSDNLEEMTGKRANIFFRLCWLIVAPVLITVSQQASFHQHDFDGRFFPSKRVITKLKMFLLCGRLFWFSPSSSSNQPAMRAMSSLPGLRGLAGSLHWPPSSGFLWAPFTHYGCYLAHSSRWCIFTHVCVFPPPKTLQLVPVSWSYKIKLCVNIIRTIDPAETEAVHHTTRPGWDVKDGVLWEGRKRRVSGHRCHQLQHPSTWKTFWSDKLLIPHMSTKSGRFLASLS